MKPILIALTSVWLCLLAVPADAAFELYVEHAKGGTAKVFLKNGRWVLFELKPTEKEGIYGIRVTDISAPDINRVYFTRVGAFPCNVRIKPNYTLAYCRTPGKPSQFK